jgi:predicted ATP-dependent serine protease
MIENKVAEAVRLGFTKIIIPKSAKVNDSKFKNIEIVRISTVKDLPALIKS